jgi:hypothetical protein
MGIPVPGRGYWARVQSGQVPLRAKLPKIKAGQKAVVNLDKRGHILEETKELQDVAGYIESEAHPDNKIVVPDELIDPLPLAEKTAKSLRAAGADDHGMVRPRAKRCLGSPGQREYRACCTHYGCPPQGSGCARY